MCTLFTSYLLLLFPTRRIVREECAGEEHDAKIFPDPLPAILVYDNRIQSVAAPGGGGPRERSPEHKFFRDERMRINSTKISNYR